MPTRKKARSKSCRRNSRRRKSCRRKTCKGGGQNERNAYMAQMRKKLGLNDPSRVSAYDWIGSMPMYHKFNEKFKDKEWDEVFNYSEQDIIGLGIPAHAAKPLYKIIQGNPYRDSYLKIGAPNMPQPNIDPFEMSPSNWMNSIPKFKKFSKTFKYTDWDILRRYSTNQLKEMGIPDNSVDSLYARIQTAY